jgi:hypothetical protein
VLPGRIFLSRRLVFAGEKTQPADYFEILNRGARAEKFL